ncbi:MAG: TRAP transporter large permease subunit, partial [Pseudomonadota bacterium]
ALSLYSIFMGYKIGVNKTKFKWSELLRTAKDARYVIPLPIIIIGGIYGGIFTVSEAAAITAVYVLIMEIFLHKDISIKKDLVHIVKESSMLTGALIAIIGMALAFTNYVIEQDVPFYLVDLMKNYISTKTSFLMILNVFLIVICMIDNFSAILIVVPLIIPIANAFGINPYHLGVIFLINLEIGFLTPPIGLNIFISSLRFKHNALDVFRATLPFYLVLVVCLLLITYIPWFTLFLLK